MTKQRPFPGPKKPTPSTGGKFAPSRQPAGVPAHARGDRSERPRGAADGRPEVRANKPTNDSDRMVVGRHAVEAVLRYQTDRAIELCVIDTDDELAALARQHLVRVRTMERHALEGMAGGHVHQGAVLTCGPYPYVSVDEIEVAPDITLVLDGVVDPRNLGAAARAAFALGATLLVTPADRAAQCTTTAHKTAAGALSRLQVARETNLKRALEKLKAKGAWIVGAEADGDKLPWQVDMTGPVVLVVGGEDTGLRRLTRDACDHVVRIPMAEPDMSLNAADAASLLMYEALRQRRVAK